MIVQNEGDFAQRQQFAVRMQAIFVYENEPILMMSVSFSEDDFFFMNFIFSLLNDNI